jgi:C4-dicarboxylate-specific signal transduction histidine kinase
MKNIDGMRELDVSSRQAETGKAVVTIADRGAGLSPVQAQENFKAFFATSGRAQAWSLDQSLDH